MTSRIPPISIKRQYYLSFFYTTSKNQVEGWLSSLLIFPIYLLAWLYSLEAALSIVLPNPHAHTWNNIVIWVCLGSVGIIPIIASFFRKPHWQESFIENRLLRIVSVLGLTALYQADPQWDILNTRLPLFILVILLEGFFQYFRFIGSLWKSILLIPLCIFLYLQRSLVLESAILEIISILIIWGALLGSVDNSA